MRIILTTLLNAALLFFAQPVIAAQAPVTGLEHGAVEAPVAPELTPSQRNCMTLSQAVEQVRKQYDGRIVDAQTRVSGGQETHVIKVLTNDGKVRTVRIPGCRV